MNNMSDLSFTKTSRAMRSKPLDRDKEKVKTVAQIAKESKGVKPIVRRKKNSDPSYFIGC